MIQVPSYTFFWQKDFYIGVPLQDEKSKLVVTAGDGVEVEISPMMIENGRAVIPVRLNSTVKGPFSHQVKFEFVEG